ncbi:MAG: O-fucosyltransferase family protein [Acetivibrionales bacterium]
MRTDRFLLIKSWGCGFWSDVDHVMGQLLAAELTGRIPVVYWGTNSLYSESFKGNAFELYFEPVSGFTVEDLNQAGFTYYPPIWNGKNLTVEDLDKVAWNYRNLGDMMQSEANVVVSDVHYFIRPILHYIPKSHWAYGMTAQQIYRCLFDKYIRLKPDIKEEIQQFYDEFMKDSKPLLGVHIRGGDKVREVENLSHLNKRYHKTIQNFINRYDIQKILVLTDCEEILADFRKRYGRMVIFTDCKRGQISDTENAPHLTSYSERRRKGIEIIKDTCLASMCDFFIGNGYSNVSYTVKRLRDWPESNIVLFYRDLRHELKLAKKRVKADQRRRKLERIRHKTEYPELYGGVNTYADEPIPINKITG